MIGQTSPTSALTKFADSLKSVAARVAALERTNGSPGWVSFTPSWTNVTLGNGSASGRYKYQNDDMMVQVTLVFGSSTSFGGVVSVAIPNGVTSKGGGLRSVGALECKLGTSEISGHSRGLSASTTIEFFAATASSSGNAVSASNPGVWATNDVLACQIVIPL